MANRTTANCQKKRQKHSNVATK